MNVKVDSAIIYDTVIAQTKAAISLSNAVLALGGGKCNNTEASGTATDWADCLSTVQSTTGCSSGGGYFNWNYVDGTCECCSAAADALTATEQDDSANVYKLITPGTADTEQEIVPTMEFWLYESTLDIPLTTFAARAVDGT